MECLLTEAECDLFGTLIDEAARCRLKFWLTALSDVAQRAARVDVGHLAGPAVDALAAEAAAMVFRVQEWPAVGPGDLYSPDPTNWDLLRRLAERLAAHTTTPKEARP